MIYLSSKNFRVFFGILWLLLIYPVSLFLPHATTVENGIIENIQLFVLLATALFFIFYFFLINRNKICILASSFFILLFGREISFGRVFFEIGQKDGEPVYIALQEIPAYPLIYAIIIILCLTILYGLVRWVRWRNLLFSTPFPIGEFFLISILLDISILCDKYLYKQHQFEELAELGLYILLSLTSLYYAFRLPSSINNQSNSLPENK